MPVMRTYLHQSWKGNDVDVTQIYENAAAEAARLESQRRERVDALIRRIDASERQLAEQVSQVFGQFDKLRQRLYASYEAHLDNCNDIRTELVMLRGDSQKVLQLEGGKGLADKPDRVSSKSPARPRSVKPSEPTPVANVESK